MTRPTPTNKTSSDVERAAIAIAKRLNITPWERLPWSEQCAYLDTAKDVFAATAPPRIDESVVETVARAIHDARFREDDAHAYSFDEEDAGGQAYCRKLARAALTTSPVEPLRRALEEVQIDLLSMGFEMTDGYVSKLFGETPQRVLEKIKAGLASPSEQPLRDAPQ